MSPLSVFHSARWTQGSGTRTSIERDPCHNSTKPYLRWLKGYLRCISMSFEKYLYFNALKILRSHETWPRVRPEACCELSPSTAPALMVLLTLSNAWKRRWLPPECVVVISKSPFPIFRHARAPWPLGCNSAIPQPNIIHATRKVTTLLF